MALGAGIRATAGNVVVEHAHRALHLPDLAEHLGGIVGRANQARIGESLMVRGHVFGQVVLFGQQICEVQNLRVDGALGHRQPALALSGLHTLPSLGNASRVRHVEDVLIQLRRELGDAAGRVRRRALRPAEEEVGVGVLLATLGHIDRRLPVAGARGPGKLALGGGPTGNALSVEASTQSYSASRSAMSMVYPASMSCIWPVMPLLRAHLRCAASRLGRSLMTKDVEVLVQQVELALQGLLLRAWQLPWAPALGDEVDVLAFNEPRRLEGTLVGEGWKARQREEQERDE